MSARPTTAAAALLAGLAMAAPARASEADAFENKVPPIAGQLYPKRGRFEVTPSVNFSVNDPFYSKVFGGLALTWHPSDLWSVGAYGAGGTASPSGSTNICLANQGCSPASQVELRQVPGKILWMAGLEGGLSPVYGKLNILAEVPVHFDLSFLLGVDWIVHQKAVEAAVAASGDPGSASSIGGHVGLGMRLFLSGLLALRFEVRDYLYQADIGLVGEKQWQNQLFLGLGLSFFLPASVRGDR